ncbi:bifunctional ADP-dependent NAD(P)H-hydrate dehydratase/NAD(P)H-hydrate epimerase [Pengzhenrongella frigida]|uniref:bifunctional ADP-dependent NAD(P)H-hydrate dehydratase/NAD(P)H-hydrate epimerase n=1 Tax=Pengzhenrongella frigida TaxID=1259133 RepID=UPI003D9C7624
MILGYLADQVRAAELPLLDAEPDDALMQRAAFGLAVHVSRALRSRRGRVGGSVVVALIGPGNNGGDALYAGAELARRGVAVLAVAFAPRVHARGRAALLAAGGRVVTVADGDLDAIGLDAISPATTGPKTTDAGTVAAVRGSRIGVAEAVAAAGAADVVLDGLLGIGARGPLRGTAAEAVQLLGALVADADADADGNADPHPSGRGRRRPFVVAVDTPSGIGVDDGVIPGPVLPADLTVTFGAAKAGLLLPPVSGVVGRLEIVDLGLALPSEEPACARLAVADVAALWPVPQRNAHKYSRGVLGVVAGTPAYPGAAVLTVSAAVRAGVGMVRFAGSPGVTAVVLAARPEVVAGQGRVQAWVLGPGLDPDDHAQAARARDALARALATAVPAVVDAGALTVLPDLLAPWVVLTPHAGELAQLLAERGEAVERTAIEAAPLHWARRAHELTGATVLLKGATTVVVGVGGAVYAQDYAPAWLATAGAGDVLAGLLGAMLAGRGQDVVEEPSLAAALAAAAALVHGLAAHRAQPGGPVSALAVADALPATIAAILARSDPARSAAPRARVVD